MSGAHLRHDRRFFARPDQAAFAHPLAEEDIYDGRRRLGAVKALTGRFVATLDNGKRLGKFPNRKAAAAAIMAADRGTEPSANFPKVAIGTAEEPIANGSAEVPFQAANLPLDRSDNFAEREISSDTLRWADDGGRAE